MQCLFVFSSERFLELRRIQLGERPVTSGNARESLESFFNRAINGPTTEERNEEEAQNRPENVANDVETLLQLSRVRAALQNGFRNQLESALSGRTTTSTTTTPQVNRRRYQRSSNLRTNTTSGSSGNLDQRRYG